MNDHVRGYTATPKLELELARHGQASLDGGRYRATVASAGPGHFEAWTDTPPYRDAVSTREEAISRQVRPAEPYRVTLS